MKYQVVLEKRAQKELDKVDIRYKPRIIATLLDLSQNPYVGKKLEGELSGMRSIRVWPYRVVYVIKNEALIVLIIKIGHRQGVYK